MFNINDTLRTFITAERINASRNLTDEDKVVLLEALAVTFPIEMQGIPEAALRVHASIQRMTRNERANLSKQGRQASGVEDEAPVVAERTEEAPTEAPRTTEGVQEQAEDAGSSDGAGSKPARSPRGRKAQA